MDKTSKNHWNYKGGAWCGEKRKETMKLYKRERNKRPCEVCKKVYNATVDGTYKWCADCSYVGLGCENCNEFFIVERKTFNHRGAKYCSLTCSREHTSFSKGHLSGEKHHNWKGGINSVIARRARLKGAVGGHTLKEWEELKRKHNFTCLRCKKQEPEIKLSVDHIKPISKCGSNYIENIQPLCLPCNQKKHAREISYV